MKLRWIVLCAVGAVALACWAALGIGLATRAPSKEIWIAIVTATAISSEAFLWTAAGVLGWNFLAGRKKMLARWFGKREAPQN